MLVNNIFFFITVNKYTLFVTTEFIDDSNTGTPAKLIETVCKIYYIRGFQVKIYHMDVQFEPICSHVPDGVLINTINNY